MRAFNGILTACLHFLSLHSRYHKSFSYQDTLPLRSFLVCILNCDKTSKIFSTNVYAKFEENRSKGTKVRARKRSADGRTDGQTDGHSKFGGYNMIIYIYQCLCKILLNFVYSFLRY